MLENQLKTEPYLFLKMLSICQPYLGIRVSALASVKVLKLILIKHCV